MRSKHFKYTQSAHFRGNRAKVTIELQVKASQVAPEDFGKYAEDLKAVDAARAGVIAVPKSVIKTAKAAKKDFAVLLRERVEDTVAKTTQAIKSGKLGGSDLAGAYCLRAGANADLGSIKESLADAGEALKLTPQSPDVLDCTGYAHFAAGEFDKSIAQYSKSLTLGADDKTFQQRGMARFYAGQLEAAAEDFAKAAEGAATRNRRPTATCGSSGRCNASARRCPRRSSNGRRSSRGALGRGRRSPSSRVTSSRASSSRSSSARPATKARWRRPRATSTSASIS